MYYKFLKLYFPDASTSPQVVCSTTSPQTGCVQHPSQGTRCPGMMSVAPRRKFPFFPSPSPHCDLVTFKCTYNTAPWPPIKAPSTGPPSPSAPRLPLVEFTLWSFSHTVFCVVCLASQFRTCACNTSLSLSYVSPPLHGVISCPYQNDHHKNLIFNSYNAAYINHTPTEMYTC